MVSGTVTRASEASCVRHGGGADQGDIAIDGTLPTRSAAFWKHPGLVGINKVLKNDAENGCIIDPGPTEARAVESSPLVEPLPSVGRPQSAKLLAAQLI